MPKLRASASRRTSFSCRGREHRPAASDHDRMDVEPVLVDQIVPHERRGQVGAAEHEVAARLGLESLDLVRDDLPHDRGVPARALECPRVDELGHVPPDAGELGHGPGVRGIGVGRGPEPGHQLVGDASVQERAHRGELRIEVPVQLVVDHVPVERVVRSLEEAVEGDRHHPDELSHRFLISRPPSP